MEIGASAFANCKNLQTINLGNKLTTMGAHAFANSGLTSVIIPETVTMWEAVRDSEFRHGYYWALDENGAFAQCSNLKNVVIKSETVPSVGFYECKSLEMVTLGENTQYIGKHAFQNDICLSKVDVKMSLKEIGAYAFRMCEKLESIDLGDSLSSMGVQAFAGSGLTSVVIPESLITWGLGTHKYMPSGIKDYYYDEMNGAFAECSNLRNVVINTEIVPEFCFYGCNSIENVTLGIETKYIKDHAFENNLCLKTVDIKAELLEIGACAFRCCEKLEGIDLGTKLLYIGFKAFANSSLKKVFIPDTVKWGVATNDYSGAFIECNKLESIYLGNVQIPKSLLDGSENVTVYCMKDTSAYNYVMEYGLPYKIFDAVPLTDVKLTTNEYTLVKGETLILHPIMTPMNSTENITWISGNEKIATVDSTGLVIAKNMGLVAMKCITSNGKSYAFTINVVESGETNVDNEPIKDISVSIVEGIENKSYTGLEITQDMSVRFYPYVELIEGIHYKVTYKNNVNTGIATITITGIVDSGYIGSIEKTFEIKDFTGMNEVEGKWYYFIDNVVAKDYIGLVENENGWWYIRNGEWDSTYTGMVEFNETWIYVKNGKWDTEYTGLAKNVYGWWHMSNGVLDLTYTGMSYNKNGWHYIENGKYTKTFTGMVKHNGIWIYVRSGKWDTEYTGLVKYKANWVYVSKGELDATYTGLVKYKTDWVYVNKGKLDATFTGMAKNQYGWWYVNKGKLDMSYTGISNNKYGCWYLNKGTIDFDYTGLVKNAYGTWYIKKGYLDMTFTGTVKIGGKTYKIKNGKLKL